MHLVESAEIIFHHLSDHNPCKISLRTPDNIELCKSPWKLNNDVLNSTIYRTVINRLIEIHKIPYQLYLVGGVNKWF